MANWRPDLLIKISTVRGLRILYYVTGDLRQERWFVTWLSLDRFEITQIFADPSPFSPIYMYTYFRLQGFPTIATNLLYSSPGTSAPVRLKSLKKGEKCAVDVSFEVQTAFPFVPFTRISPTGQHFPTNGRCLYSSGTTVSFC